MHSGLLCNYYEVIQNTRKFLVLLYYFCRKQLRMFFSSAYIANKDEKSKNKRLGKDSLAREFPIVLFQSKALLVVFLSFSEGVRLLVHFCCHELAIFHFD